MARWTICKSRLPRTVLYSAAMLVTVAATPSVLAQSNESGSRDTTVPARIGNHYNHKDYQPTTRQVCDDKPGGIDCQSAAGARADEELKRIQQQIDAQEKQPPATNSSGSSIGNR
jgi:hypothetical protein